MSDLERRHPSARPVFVNSLGAQTPLHDVHRALRCQLSSLRAGANVAAAPKVKEPRSGNFHIDYAGFSLLALTFGCMEVVLDKGQEDDWFGSPFIVAFVLISVVSFISVIFWELRIAGKKQRRILDPNLFTNRTFTLSVAMQQARAQRLSALSQMLPNIYGTISESGAQDRSADGGPEKRGIWRRRSAA